MEKIEQLQSYLQKKQFSQLFLLVDDNTSVNCMPILLEKIDEITDRQAVLLEIPHGEENKTLSTAENIIRSLAQSEADRDSCLLSLGGGVVTDLGGFVSSVFKRGIENINIPTTLVGMADAAIGGKTAVNIDGIKNLIGTFNFGVLKNDSVLSYDVFKNKVFLDTDFLSTLSVNQIKDGVAEILKTFLVADEGLSRKFLDSPIEKNAVVPYIEPCATIKERIVSQDPYDRGIRKSLNFGHTLGHAVEMFYNLSHGHSVAVGIHYALDLSVKHCNFPYEKAKAILQFIEINYELPPYDKDISQLTDLMRQDKKNTDEKINFILLEDIAKPCLVSVYQV